MRLICPNCGAQYEVADDVIPVAGRDVQCSNCGHTWFEHPGASEAAEAGEPLPPPPTPTLAPPPDIEPPPDPQEQLEDYPEPPPEPASEDVQAVGGAEPELEPVAGPETEPEPEPEPEPDTDQADEQTVLTAAGLQRRTLSPDLAEILRQEAEHEAAARATEAAARATVQGEAANSIDLDDQRGEEARRRMARMRGEPAPAIGAPAATTPTARRELLPDIEEINSSLRSATDRDGNGSGEPVAQQRKRGARFGFTTIMVLVAILVGLYLGAGRLSALFPAAEPVLTRYVAVVNDARLWIDLKMQAFIAGQSDPAPAPASETATPAVEAPDPTTESPAIEAPPAAPPTPETEAPAEPPADQTDG